MERGQLVAVEEFAGARVVGVGRAGVAPALPDFVARLLQDLLVGGVLPLDQLLDDLEEALALLLLRLGRGEEVGMRGGVVHHLREDHRPRRGQRAPRPPEMQGGRVAVADGFLAGRGDVDRVEGEGDFDEFFGGVGHGPTLGCSDHWQREHRSARQTSGDRT